STVCTGVAAKIPGTIVHAAARQGIEDRLETRIGHPAGVIETESVVVPEGNGYRVERATVGRTARRIMEGYVFPPDRAAEAGAPALAVGSAEGEADHADRGEHDRGEADDLPQQPVGRGPFPAHGEEQPVVVARVDFLHRPSSRRRNWSRCRPQTGMKLGRFGSRV